MGEFDAKEYWQHRLGEAIDLGGVGYKALGTPFNQWLYRLRRAVFLGRMRALRLPWSAMRVLDVGCGTGFYLDRWAELGVGYINSISIA